MAAGGRGEHDNEREAGNVQVLQGVRGDQSQEVGAGLARTGRALHFPNLLDV